MKQYQQQGYRWSSQDILDAADDDGPTEELPGNLWDGWEDVLEEIDEANTCLCIQACQDFCPKCRGDSSKCVR